MRERIDLKSTHGWSTVVEIAKRNCICREREGVCERVCMYVLYQQRVTLIKVIEVYATKQV